MLTPFSWYSGFTQTTIVIWFLYPEDQNLNWQMWTPPKPHNSTQLPQLGFVVCGVCSILHNSTKRILNASDWCGVTKLPEKSLFICLLLCLADSESLGSPADAGWNPMASLLPEGSLFVLSHLRSGAVLPGSFWVSGDGSPVHMHRSHWSLHR